jgi:hypothetical protein
MVAISLTSCRAQFPSPLPCIAFSSREAQRECAAGWTGLEVWGLHAVASGSKDRVTGFKGSPIPLSVFDHRLAGGIRTGIGRRSKRRYIVKSESSVNTRQFS